MASLGIPPPYRSPFIELSRLDDAAASEVVGRLEALPAYAPVTDLQRELSAAVGDAGSGLAAALLSLRGQLRTWTASEIGAALSQSRDIEIDPEARPLLQERTSALLQTAALSSTAVAVDLQTQHERNYQAARVFTDVRPVFADDVEDRPTGAVIVEMLQLQTWTRDGDAETIFVALDEKDLAQLQGVVDRALKKTATLRDFLDEKGLAYFRLEEDE